MEEIHEEILEQEVAIKSHALHVESKMLEARRNEKDFLMRLLPKYLGKHDKTMSFLYGHIKEIETIAKTSNNKKILDIAIQANEYASNYQDTFRQVYTYWEKRGLDHKSGLQGEFRGIVHSIETAFKSYQVESIYIDLLNIRSYEKDFLRTIGEPKNEKYFDKLMITIDSFLKHAATIKFGDSKRNEIDGLVKGYQTAFKNFQSAIIKNDATVKAAEYEKIRLAAHSIEAFIKANYIPNVSSQLLTIRRKEKDYLLRYKDKASAEKYSKQTHEVVNNLQSAIQVSTIPDSKKTEFNGLLDQYHHKFTELVEMDKKIALGISDMRAAIHQIEPLITGTKESPG